MTDNYKCGDTITVKTELQQFAHAYSQPTCPETHSNDGSTSLVICLSSQPHGLQTVCGYSLTQHSCAT